MHFILLIIFSLELLVGVYFSFITLLIKSANMKLHLFYFYFPFKIILWGSCVASFLRTYGHPKLSNAVLGGIAALTVTIRSLIWALMTLK